MENHKDIKGFLITLLFDIVLIIVGASLYVLTFYIVAFKTSLYGDCFILHPERFNLVIGVSLIMFVILLLTETVLVFERYDWDIKED